MSTACNEMTRVLEYIHYFGVFASSQAPHPSAPSSAPPRHRPLHPSLRHPACHGLEYPVAEQRRPTKSCNRIEPRRPWPCLAHSPLSRAPQEASARADSYGIKKQEPLGLLVGGATCPPHLFRRRRAVQASRPRPLPPPPPSIPSFRSCRSCRSFPPRPPPPFHSVQRRRGGIYSSHL